MPGNRSKMRTLLLTAAVVLVILPMAAAFLLVEKQPAIHEAQALEAAHADMVQHLVKRVARAAGSRKAMVPVSADEEEINALIALANKSFSWFSGRVAVDSQGMAAAGTLKIPKFFLGRYINSRIHLAPSDKGLDISRCSIGRIPVHPGIVKPVLQAGLNLVLGKGEGTAVLDSIEKVSFQGRRMTVQFAPMPDRSFGVGQFKDRLESIRDRFDLVGDPDLINIYYEKLLEIEQGFSPGRVISLSRFLAPLFETADQRSGPGEHARENRAAILALAVYAGHWRLEQFTGDLEGRRKPSNPSVLKNIVLAGRQDLRRHFLVSAGLKVIADAGISFTAGEFKELMDTQQGGSGFSFADLAADRAGTFFAKMAVHNDSEAEALQRGIMNNTAESYYFPDVNRLPEGISRKQFKAEFNNTESTQYKSMIQKIDQQISQLPLYN